MAQFSNSLSFLKKFNGQDRLPAAAEFEQNSEYYCAICLSDVSGGDSYRKLPECGHSFHAHCIDAWFNGSHSTCPLCRTQVFLQIISLNQNNNYQWSYLLSDILLLFWNFVERMSNPLSDELASMMCGDVMCVS